MSQQGPPADAKQAQAAALQEIEAAQRRKRALEVNLVRLLAVVAGVGGGECPQRGRTPRFFAAPHQLHPTGRR